MKKIILTLFISFFAFSAFSVFTLWAHEGGHGTDTKLWHFANSDTTLKANFIKKVDDEVYLSDENHRLNIYAFSEFSEKDQGYILAKSNWIQTANNTPLSSAASVSSLSNWLLALGIALILLTIFSYLKNRRRLNFGFGAFGLLLFAVACNSKNASVSLEALSIKVPASNLQLLEAVFGAFDNVTTRKSEQYFYIESNGIPNHKMMVGITSWQQQVPIDHDYSDKNSWAIPLQPRLAKTPLSTKENFMKGAIAIAANGIPIFNPLNNRGEDANAVGELDQWGGHSGRADDYHYHVPPTHLQDQVGEGKPIAYALDGFPVYGETTEELDEYLGRFNEDGSYQYHATKNYPYFIAAMRGVVELNPRTRAPENEISPQAHTRGVRKALGPLRGAEITDFKTINPQSYSLTYEVDGKKHLLNYNWDDEGMYRFEFVGPDGGTREETYKRKK